METYNLEKDTIIMYPCRDMKEIEKNIEDIIQKNEKILPKNKKAKILLKPNLNNDLNAMTGNSTDLRIIVSVIKSLKKRKYNKIILADGPNCGVNHVGIDVFSRLRINKIGEIFGVKLINFNNDEGKKVNLEVGEAEIAITCLDADFIINLPKIKTHVEAGITLSCKNYLGCFKGVQKREIHNNLPKNIVKMNEIVKTDLIIADGLICMEGNGPGNGIPKKWGVIFSGHNPYLFDFLVAKLIGLDYKKIEFLKFAMEKKHISEEDIEKIKNLKEIIKFKPAKKNLADRILLNNFFIKIRFSKKFESFFNKGFLPWILFKIGVKQDKYIFEEEEVTKILEKKNINLEEKEKIKKCLEKYCPLSMNTLEDKNCIKCMYCYQILPDLIEVEGKLGAFDMQNKRFGKYIKE